MLLVWLCSAFLVGIVLGDAAAAPAEPALAGACGAACIIVVWRPRGMLRLALLVAAATSLGAARSGAAAPITGERSVWAYAGAEVAIVGYVARQPDRREDKQSAVLGAEQLLVDGAVRAAEGLVLLKLPPNPELRYGQRVRVYGTLELPPSDGDFDYRAYLERHGVRVLMSRPHVEPLSGTGGAWWQRDLLRLNDRARATALRLIREPHASLLVGILLGVQSTIPEDVLETFSATGTSHILVISGWNISVIVAGVIAFLGALKLERKRAAFMCLPLIGLYVLFVGASPAVLRAALMGSLGVVAVLTDRESDAWTSLLAACAAMALLDPNVLWDIGFQLSARSPRPACSPLPGRSSAFDGSRPTQTSAARMVGRATDRHLSRVTAVTTDIAVPLRQSVACRAAGQRDNAVGRAVCDAIRLAGGGGRHACLAAGAAPGAWRVAVPGVAAAGGAVPGAAALGGDYCAADRRRLGVGLLRPDCSAFLVAAATG